MRGDDDLVDGGLDGQYLLVRGTAGDFESDAAVSASAVDADPIRAMVDSRGALKTAEAADRSGSCYYIVTVSVDVAVGGGSIIMWCC